MAVDPLMVKLDPNEQIRQSFGLSELTTKAAVPFVPIDSFLYSTGASAKLSRYRREVGEGFDSNVIMAPVMWVMRTFTEARVIVQSKTNNIWNESEDHDAQLILDRPNDYYDSDTLWKATCISYTLNGNAYWRKIRNPIGEVIELWYIPHWMITPRYPQDGSQFISYYEYMPEGIGMRPIKIPRRDIVHFRFGLDPRNTRLGLSGIGCLLREIYTDDEAASFSAKLLQNMGVIGIVISPKEVMRGTPQELKEHKEYLRTAFSGENRGSALVTSTPTDVNQYGFDPAALTLGDVRDVTEERVCAVIGIPAAIVGFGSGMQATKVGATMRELVKMAWVGCLTPMQRTMGRQLTAQLLPDFIAQTRRFRYQFDESEVGVFEEDDAALVGKVTNMVAQGVLRIDRAQKMLGLEVDEKMKVYLRPSNSVPVDENGEVIQDAAPNGTVDQRGMEIPPAVLARMGNGNGTNTNGTPAEGSDTNA
jgi:HK97 family phage portal protein